MNDKFDGIITKLGDYQNELIKYLKEYTTEASLYLKNDDEEKDYNLQPSEKLFKLAKNEIYPYILKSSKELKDEFIKRVNHYKEINDDPSYIGLQAKLYKYINELYSLVDLDAALSLEDTDMQYIEAYCITALESMNTITPIDESNYYSQIRKQVQDPSNFYSLDFDKTADEVCNEVGCTELYMDDSILNIRKIITQYENLEQPIKIEVLTKFPQLIDNVEEFREIYSNYLTSKNKLKDLLMEGFEEKDLYYFCVFDKLINCDDSMQEPGPFRYYHLYISSFFVVGSLKIFIEEENGDSSSISMTDLKKVATIFEPLYENKNKIVKEENDRTKINRDELLNKIDLIPSRKKALEFVLKDNKTLFEIEDFYSYYYNKGDYYLLPEEEQKQKINSLEKYLNEVNKKLKKFFPNFEHNYIFPEKMKNHPKGTPKKSGTWHVNIPVKID